MPKIVVSTPRLLAPSLVFRRRWNSWWKRLRSCLLSMSSGSLSSSPLTFQFALGMVLVGRLQGFLPGQFSSSSVSRSQTFQFLIMVSLEVFKVFTQDRVQPASSEQIVEFPVPHGGPHLQDPGLASLPQEVAGEAFQVEFLALFPRSKKSAKNGPHSGSELLPESSPSTLAAHSDQFWEDESGGTWMLMPSGRWYLLCSDQKFSGWPGMMGMESDIG